MRTIVLVACLAFAGCLEANPPGGQFVCTSEEGCPDGFTCQADGRCYDDDRVPDCFLQAQIGCGAGQGCYWSPGETGGPLCLPAGPLGQYADNCDNSMDGTRCRPGHACVNLSDLGAFCLRYCTFDSDCDPGDLCSIGLDTGGDRWFVGNVSTVCAPPTE